MELTYIATRDGRLSSFLKGELQMSTGLMNKLKWGDSIRVNGEPQRTNFAVQTGDRITVRLDEEEPEYPAEDGEISILYEDVRMTYTLKVGMGSGYKVGFNGGTKITVSDSGVNFEHLYSL